MMALIEPRNGAVPADSRTLAEAAFELLRRDILIGAHNPDSKLAIHDLTQRYGIGATPMREALSRLSTLGLVRAIGQRGFRVTAVSREDLTDLVRMRCLIEIEALRLSMERGGDDWEADIVATLHRLRKFIDRSTAAFREGQVEFDAIHKQFHRSLIAACGSPRLIALQDTLYDQMYRYRLVMMRSFPRPRDLDDAHAALAEQVLRRDVDAACDILARHLGSTLAFVYPESADDTNEAAKGKGRKS
jgi:GntR family transcriptional regulator, carbon starvation induced regulator